MSTPACMYVSWDKFRSHLILSCPALCTQHPSPGAFHRDGKRVWQSELAHARCDGVPVAEPKLAANDMVYLTRDKLFERTFDADPFTFFPVRAYPTPISHLISSTDCCRFKVVRRHAFWRDDDVAVFCVREYYRSQVRITRDQVPQERIVKNSLILYDCFLRTLELPFLPCICLSGRRYSLAWISTTAFQRHPHDLRLLRLIFAQPQSFKKTTREIELDAKYSYALLPLFRYRL